MKTQIAIRSIGLIFLLVIQGLSQEEKDQLLIQRQQKQKEIAERVEANWRETTRILQEEYPADDASLPKTMTLDQITRHRDAIFEQYKKMGYNSGYQALYNRHILPNKYKEVERMGMLKQPGQVFSYRDHALTSEVIIIGRVRKIVYHSGKGTHFQTSSIIVVDEWLRDDFGLHKKYREVVVKSMGGSEEAHLHKGERLLLFLSRDGYVIDLVSHIGHYGKDDFIPNTFAAMGPRENFFVKGSEVVFGNNWERFSLAQVKADIATIVRVLDVQNFYKSN